jgi:hypothetical protein
VERARTYYALSLPQQFATTREVAAFWADAEVLGIQPERVRALLPSALRVDSEALAASAARDVPLRDLVFVVVGDRAKVEKELRAAGLTPTRTWTIEDLLGPR